MSYAIQTLISLFQPIRNFLKLPHSTKVLIRNRLITLGLTFLYL